MCEFNYMFITEVTVKGVAALDYIILKGVSKLLSFPLTYMRGRWALETPQYNATSNYDLNAKTCSRINTYMCELK